MEKTNGDFLVSDAIFSSNNRPLLSSTDINSPKISSSHILPINRLPFEVLAQVFACALPIVHSADDVQAPSVREAPLSISHVCQEWRSLALSSRQLWTQIHFNINEYISLERMQAAATCVISFIERSMGYPLVINIQGLLFASSPLHRMVSSGRWTKLGKSLSKALIHAQPRWYLVSIRIPSAVWRLGNEENGEWDLDQCSLLEELQFKLFMSFPTTGLRDDLGKMLSIDLKSCTRIRRLLLGDWHSKLVDNAFPTFSQLTTFRIPWSSLFSMDVVFKILSCAPLLEELQLKVSFSDFMPESDATSVHLPRLRKIHVIGMEGWRPRTLPYAGATEGDLVNILDRLKTPALECLNLSAGDSDSERTVESMIRVLQRSSAPLTTLTLQCHAIATDLLFQCLTFVPRLERLGFSPLYFKPDPLFQILTVSKTTPEDAVLCPLLRNLTIQYPISGCNRKYISQLLLSRSPPNTEMYSCAQTSFPEGTMAQKALRGTSVLRSFNFASVHNSGIYDFDSDGVYKSDDSEHELSFVKDDVIGSLVGRGLKLNVGC